MTGQAEERVAERLRLALEMFELGESMMLERLRRQFPHAGESELQELLNRWLGIRIEPDQTESYERSADGRG